MIFLVVIWLGVLWSFVNLIVICLYIGVRVFFWDLICCWILLDVVIGVFLSCCSCCCKVMSWGLMWCMYFISLCMWNLILIIFLGFKIFLWVVFLVYIFILLGLILLFIIIYVLLWSFFVLGINMNMGCWYMCRCFMIMDLVCRMFLKRLCCLFENFF